MRRRAARAERHVVERELACARDREEHEQEEHERGELQRLAQREEPVRPVHEEHRAGEDRNLCERRNAREESEHQQQAADKMRDHHIVHQESRAEPRRGLPGPFEEIHDIAGRGVRDHQQAAGKQAEAEVNANAIEPVFAMRVRPFD